MKLARITVDPADCTGKPCVRGLRFPVARLLGLLAAGSTRDLAEYPYLELEDIDEALQYAACWRRMRRSNWHGEISDRYAAVAGSWRRILGWQYTTLAMRVGK
jgi:uncharacterized protein (DUF433 family)